MWRLPETNRPGKGTFWSMNKGRRDSIGGSTGRACLWAPGETGWAGTRACWWSWTQVAIWIASGPAHVYRLQWFLNSFSSVVSHLILQQAWSWQSYLYHSICKVSACYTSQQVLFQETAQGQDHPPWQAVSCSLGNFANFRPWILASKS